MKEEIITAIDDLILAAFLEGGVSDDRRELSKELVDLRKKALLDLIEKNAKDAARYRWLINAGGDWTSKLHNTREGLREGLIDAMIANSKSF